MPIESSKKETPEKTEKRECSWGTRRCWGKLPANYEGDFCPPCAEARGEQADLADLCSRMESPYI
jgi:hypothetical protein